MGPRDEDAGAVSFAKEILHFQGPDLGDGKHLAPEGSFRKLVSKRTQDSIPVLTSQLVSAIEKVAGAETFNTLLPFSQDSPSTLRRN